MVGTCDGVVDRDRPGAVDQRGLGGGECDPSLGTVDQDGPARSDEYQ